MILQPAQVNVPGAGCVEQSDGLLAGEDGVTGPAAGPSHVLQVGGEAGLQDGLSFGVGQD